MKNLLAKLGFGEKLSKNIWAILIVAFSGAIIYGLPYFRFDYYDAYLATYHLTNTQMGVFGSILGVFGMISYLFGWVVSVAVALLYWLAELHLSPLQRKALLPFGLAPLLMAEEVA